MHFVKRLLIISGFMSVAALSSQHMQQKHVLSPGLHMSDLSEAGSELIGMHIFGNPLNIKKFYTNTFPI